MKTILSVISACVILLGALCWQQRQHIQTLENTLAQTIAEREAAAVRHSDTEQKLAAVESAHSTLQEQIRTMAEARPRRMAPGEPAPPSPATTMAVLDNPRMQQVMAASMKSSLDQRYGALFRMLKLSPTELDALKDLMTEKQMAGIDVIRAAQAKGLSPGRDGEQINTLMTSVMGEVDGNIQTLLGDDRFGQFQEYNQNIAAYTLVDQVEQRLSYTNAPLQGAQRDAFLKVLVANAPTLPPEMNSVMGGFVQSISGNNPMVAGLMQSPLSEQALTEARQVLSPPQMEVLEQLRTEQANQANSIQSLRRSIVPTPPAAP